ncbi:MAG TPA: nucleoside deaminase [Candidatus Didemnitutus sp.]
MDLTPRPPLSCPFEKIHPSQLLRDDAFFMVMAYNQAIDAWREDEVPIGAVIERGGEIIASAHNRRDATRDPTAHAEVIAFGQAARAIGDWRLSDATLYVTKEPCPMCSGAALMSRVKRVVYAVGDPKMGCLGGAADLNTLAQVNHHLAITTGVLVEPCLALLQAYFKLKRTEDSGGS